VKESLPAEQLPSSVVVQFDSMPRFQTAIRKARFVHSPYTATEMQDFAPVLTDSIRARIENGQNIYDQAVAPLKPGCLAAADIPDYKAARGLQPIRDWACVVSDNPGFRPLARFQSSP
jgi:hypothetical protein